MKRKRPEDKEPLVEDSHRLFNTMRNVVSNWIETSQFTIDDIDSKLQKHGYCARCFRSTGFRGSACHCYDLIHTQSELDRLRIPQVLIDLILQYAQPIQIQMKMFQPLRDERMELEEWAHKTHPTLVFHEFHESRSYEFQESCSYARLCEKARTTLSSLLKQHRLKWSYYCNDKNEFLLVAMNIKKVYVMKHDDVSVNELSFESIGLYDIPWSGLEFMCFKDGLKEFTIVYRSPLGFNFYSMTIPFHTFQSKDVGVCIVDIESTIQEEYLTVLKWIRQYIIDFADCQMPLNVIQRDEENNVFIASQGFCYGCLQRHHQCDGWKETEKELKRNEVIHGNMNLELVIFKNAHYGLEYKNKDGILFAYRSDSWKCNHEYDTDILQFGLFEIPWLRKNIHGPFTLDEYFGAVILEFNDKDGNNVYFLLRRVTE